MAFVEIPLRSDIPAYRFQVELEGALYFLSVNWNRRTERWNCSIADQDQVPIVDSVPMFTGFPLFSRFKDVRLPPGLMYVIDTSDQSVDPKVDTLGTRHILLYRESTTVE